MIKIRHYLTPNEYSRPQKPNTPKGIIIHYTAVYGQKALQTIAYFESLKNQKTKKQIYASTQFVVDINGDVYQLMPENEMCYGVSTPIDYANNPYPIEVHNVFGKSVNKNALQIEMCIDNDGNLTKEAILSTTELVKDILKRYNLGTNKVFRHYDCTGKICPKPFVDDEKAWLNFLVGIAFNTEIQKY
jgi:N-acetylmuramoyl-L-alanine amidase